MHIIVVGAGPAGLTAAWLLAKFGHKVTIVEKAKSLGGCHRVLRYNGKFTEHGPRVYSTSYKTLQRIIGDMGGDFNEMFTPYKFNIRQIGNRSISSMSFYELYKLTLAYINHMIYSDFTSMKEYTKDFTPETIDYLDRLCRLTDGASLSNYTVAKFVGLLNQQALYNFYIPNQPNDLGLFKLWEDNLKNLNVDIQLETDVKSLNITDNVVTGITTNKGIITADSVILAIPPVNIGKLTNAFIPKSGAVFDKWANDNSYIDYITVNFEWNNKIPLKPVWGLTETDWGVAYIVMSDYFSSNNTMITAGLTNIDAANKNGIIARTSSDEIIISETLKQLRQTYPELPEPDSAIIGSRPGQEAAYIRSAKDPSFLPYDCFIKNLYNIGTQNGFLPDYYTSMENAIVNAHAVVHKIEPKSSVYKIKTPWTLNMVLILILILIIISISVYVGIKQNIMGSYKK